VRLIDSCITQLKAQGPSRTCNESKEEKEFEVEGVRRAQDHFFFFFFTLVAGPRRSLSLKLSDTRV